MADSLVGIAVLTELLLMTIALGIGQFLQRIKFVWIGEAGSSLLLGLGVGVIMFYAGVGEDFKASITFKSFLFLDVFLPAIMFDAGYSLDPKPFIRNVGGVCVTAFLGTTISTFVIGIMLYGFGQLGWCYQMDFLHNCIFGAIISATDPVTVLAIFSRLGANEDLYIRVFGESVLNDAAATVLYQTLIVFLDKAVTARSALAGVGKFIGIFLGSLAMGVGIGLGAAVIFRTRWFHHKHVSFFETGMVIVLAYISYLAAQAAYLSGICSVVFCGMVMRAYLTPSLSPATQESVHNVFTTMACLFELFLFIYIGLSLFLTRSIYNIWTYAAFTILALAISRAANIFPLTAVVNWLRLPEYRISGKQQFMMWWSGLRGALAFALAVDASETLGEPGEVMKTCTFYMVFLTVLVNGGTTGFLLGKLNLLKDSPSSSSTSETVAELPAKEMEEIGAPESAVVVQLGLTGDSSSQAGAPKQRRGLLQRAREFNSINMERYISQLDRRLDRLVGPKAFPDDQLDDQLAPAPEQSRSSRENSHTNLQCSRRSSARF